MKKQIVALVLITGLTIATGASANWGKGQGGGGFYNNCPQGPMMQGQMFQQLDQATQDKIKQFFADTQPLHKEMAMKRAEKRALMAAATPDAKAVAKISGELFDLRTTLRLKAVEAGVDQYVGAGRMGRGGRGGHGRGMQRGFQQF